MKEPPADERAEPSRLDEGLKQRLEGLVPEVLRRTLYAGLEAVFTTEEGVRKLANDFSLPKDVARYLIQQTQSSRNELFRIMAAELRIFLEKLNFSEELQRVLTGLSLEITTEIRFVPDEKESQWPKARVKNKVLVKRSPQEGQEKPALSSDAETPGETRSNDLSH